MKSSPFVSVVITTLNRPVLVCRAVSDALGQTYEHLETVVVVDGPDAATIEALEKLNQPRLRILALAENVGLAEARNVGIRAAAGDWVAFLDDDDEWMKNKIETQIAALVESDPAINFVACRYEERNKDSSRSLPREFPAADRQWSEYMFRDGGVLLPSTFLVEKSLMRAIPFRKGMRYHEDADWLLRAKASNAIHPAWVEDVLTIYHNELEGQRLSTKTPWEGRYRWCKENPELLTRKAFPYYIARLCVPYARNSTAPIRSCAFLLFAAIRSGGLNFRSAAYLFLALFTGPEWRRKLRRNVLSRGQ